MGGNTSKISDISTWDIEISNDKETSKKRQKNLSKKTSERFYVFLALVSFDKNKPNIATEISNQINKNKSSVEFFASLEEVGESEAYIGDPESVFIALPKNFKMKFTGAHDGNARFTIIDNIKPEYVVGILKSAKTVQLIQPTSINTVYFLDTRGYGLEASNNKEITAHQIYVSTIRQKNVWVGEVSFSVLAANYGTAFSYPKSFSLASYKIQLPTDSNMAKLVWNTRTIASAINQRILFHQLPRPLIINILSQTVDVKKIGDKTTQEVVEKELEKYFPSNKK